MVVDIVKTRGRHMVISRIVACSQLINQTLRWSGKIIILGVTLAVALVTNTSLLL